MTAHTSDPSDFAHGEREPIDAGYVWLEVHGEQYRTFYETAGDGPLPLVCLHPAAADTRQFRHLLNDETVSERCTVYAFDLPWHGRTFPPLSTEWWDTEYRLTTEFYADFVMDFVRAMDVDRPVVMGCAMGGAIVLQLAIDHASDLRAVIGLETIAHTEGRGFDYFEHPRINEEVARAEWAYSFQAPQSPERYRREAWWINSQAGDGAFVGDLYFYGVDWDARDDLDRIDTDACPVYLLTGEYDFSATPEKTRAVADAIDGVHFEVMDEVGHFPMAENPAVFTEYFSPIVDEILDAST